MSFHNVKDLIEHCYLFISSIANVAEIVAHWKYLEIGV